MAINALEYLTRSSAFLSVRSLLKDLCHLDLTVYDLHGRPVQSPDAVKKSTDSDFFDQVFQRNKNSLLPKNSEHIPQAVIQQLAMSKQPVIFIGADRFTKIITPIMEGEEAVGLVYTSETASVNLQKNQIKSIIAYLQNTLQRILKEDFKLFRGLEGNDMTHQRKILCRVTEYITKHFHVAELNMNQVCRNNNVSYYYLSHLFKKELKTSFSKYLSSLRMDVASRLLKDRSLTVSQISRSCGFEDPGYFTKVFKKIRGTSPVAYRDSLFSRRGKKGRKI